jgi:crossover junction endodeoxyribonuclease RusA
MAFIETLPYPPSINSYYGRRPRGGVYIKAAGQAYRKEVVELIAKNHPSLKTMDEPLAVRVDIYQPDNRRRDADNVLKALLDALTHAGVYRDDCLIFDLHVRKLGKDECDDKGYVVVYVGPLEG